MDERVKHEDRDLIGQRVIESEFGTGTIIDVAFEEETNQDIFCVRFDKKNVDILHEGLENTPETCRKNIERAGVGGARRKN